MANDAASFVGERHALVGSLQQGQAQFALQILDRSADGGLGDMQNLRGFTDAAGLVDGDQCLDLMEFHLTTGPCSATKVMHVTSARPPRPW
ncbi:hypothetical protein D3C73_1358130 [compost metagenome]